MAFNFVVTSVAGQKPVGRPQNISDRPFTPNLIYPQERETGPTNYAYTLYGRGKDALKILSRIVPAGSDSIGRPGNFLSHHLELTDEDIARAKCGPAFLLKKRSWLAKWEHDGFQYYPENAIAEGDYLAIDILPKWMQDVPGFDWEADLFDKLKDPTNNAQKCVILYDGTKISGENILDIFYIALSRIVDPAMRWDITFATSAATIHAALGWKWMGVDCNDEKSRKKLLPVDWKGNPKPNGPISIDLTKIGE